MFSTLLYVALAVTSVLAAVEPIAPGPGDTFFEYGNCTLSWKTASGSKGGWKNMTIDLMSGSNLNMSKVINVAKGIDGTDSSLSPFTWTCPPVDPYSAIYFYQLTPSGDKDSPAWTTRFTIAAVNGHTTPPPNATQPNGDPVPWGLGSLAFNETHTAELEALAKSTLSHSGSPDIEGPSWHAASQKKNKDDQHHDEEDVPALQLDSDSLPSGTSDILPTPGIGNSRISRGPSQIPIPSPRGLEASAGFSLRDVTFRGGFVASIVACALFI